MIYVNNDFSSVHISANPREMVMEAATLLAAIHKTIERDHGKGVADNVIVEIGRLSAEMRMENRR